MEFYANQLPDIAYSQPDECKLDMYLPVTDDPCPVLIFFHGGGLESGSRKTGEVNSLLPFVQNHIAVVSCDYRLYPNARFPDFLEDAAKAVSWVFHYRRGGFHFNQFYLGGSSAGAYIAMMLYFDSRYLQKYGIEPNRISKYVFDAGQPTVHFNVLRERGEDPRAIRVDSAAPIYFINHDLESPETAPDFLIVAAEHDMPGRLEQIRMMQKTMQIFGYDMSRVRFRLMKGFSHCAYIGATDENGEDIYYKLLRDFILGQRPGR